MLSSDFLKNSAKKVLQGKWAKAFYLFLLAGAGALIVAIVIGILQTPFIERANEYAELFLETKNQLYYQDFWSEWVKIQAFELLGVVGTVLSWIVLFPILLVFMEWADGEQGSFRTACKRIGEGMALYFQIGVRVFLWSLLFIIPGVIKSLAYALAPMIKAKNPERTASECIRESERLMYGKKAALFIVYLTFIGWYLLVYLAAMGASYIPYAGPYLAAIVQFAAAALLNVYITMTEVMFYRETVHPTTIVYAVPGQTYKPEDPFTENNDPFDDHKEDPFA